MMCPSCSMTTLSRNPSQLAQIGDRLLRARTALGLNQRQFALQAEIAANTYNQWERAIGRPSLDQAMKLCDAHGLTLDYIFRGDISGLPMRIAERLRNI